MNDQAFLSLLPLSLLVIFALTISFYEYSGSNVLYVSSKGSLSESRIGESTNCTCDHDGKSVDYCYETSSAVLGGVDMVQFFTTYKLSDGTYDETEVGQQGSDEYSSTYMNYTYYFVSEANQRLFEEDPSHYVPQWGGFCAWGIATEHCPTYSWSPTCMGPHGSWYHWTIQNDKIYFFWFAKARLNFLNDIDGNIILGDARWEEWYPVDNSTAPVSTNCVEKLPL